MADRFLIRGCLLSLLLSLSLHSPAMAESDPDKDPHLRAMVTESERLAKAKRSSAAIEDSQTVIAAFEAYYGKEQRKVYCGKYICGGFGQSAWSSRKK